MGRGARQASLSELSYSEKISVLDNLDGFTPKIDISGGDPLAVPDTLPLIQECSNRFGSPNVTVTATGATLRRMDPGFAKDHVGELNFTYDMPGPDGSDTRPPKYSEVNLAAAKRFMDVGLSLRAECPLTTRNVSPVVIRQIFNDLHVAGVKSLLATRMFPVGRGERHATLLPSPEQYRIAISELREMEARLGYPKLKLQCALRFFDNPGQSENPCDLMRVSFGLMPEGTLLASPWAYGLRGRPLDDVWVLGNLANDPLSKILSSEKAQYYRAHLNDNFGHCKVICWVNSPKLSPVDRLFDVSDPLAVAKGPL